MRPMAFSEHPPLHLICQLSRIAVNSLVWGDKIRPLPPNPCNCWGDRGRPNPDTPDIEIAGNSA